MSAAASATRSLSRRIRPGRRRLLASGVALGAVAVLAACSPPGYGNYSPTAGRAATVAESAAVSSAVHASPLTAKARKLGYRVIAVRVSRLSPTYAFATIDPTSPQLDGAAVALRRSAATARTWSVTDIGSAQVGCAEPAQVRIEFALSC